MNHFVIKLLVAILVAYPSVFAQANNQPAVLVSIQPLAFLANAVIGERGQVDILLPNNASPHHYALKVSDRQRLISADLVLWVGSELENFLTKPIAQRRGGVVTAMKLSGLQWPEISNKGDHAGHDHGDKDPHLWLNPLNNIPIVNALVDKLGRMSPNNAAYYQANGQRMNTALRQLDQQLLKKMQPLQKGHFIVAHPAYSHFVSRYGLQQLDYLALSPERHVGAKHLYQLRQQRQAQCVFKDYGFPAGKAEQLARDLNIPLLSLDALGIQAAELKSQDNAPVTGAEKFIYLIEQLADEFQRCLTKTK